MQVVSKLPRRTTAQDGRVIAAGFDVPFGLPGHPPKTVYKFRPHPNDTTKEGEQACEVTDEEHLAVFASIPEGYEIRPTPDDPVPTDDKAKAEVVAKKNAAKQAKEKESLKKAETKGAALKRKRQEEESEKQRKLNNAANRRQKRAVENKGKGAEGADPENSFLAADLEKSGGGTDSED
jgi:hypothetical protein